jgi:hypothetical protein
VRRVRFAIQEGPRWHLLETEPMPLVDACRLALEAATHGVNATIHAA